MCFVYPVSAEDSMSDLIPYAEKLEYFNQKYGTMYTFEDTAFSDEETINFYRQFTTDEFECYLYNMYLKESDEFEIHYENPNPNLRRISTQYVYYGENFLNYFCVTHTVEYAYNQYVFVSFESLDNHSGEFPYYEIISASYNMNDAHTSDTISMKCNRYIAPGLIDMAEHTVEFTVTPYGGDQYWFPPAVEV